MSLKSQVGKISQKWHLDWPNLVAGAIIGVIASWLLPQLFTSIEHLLLPPTPVAIKQEGNTIHVLGKFGSPIRDLPIETEVKAALLTRSSRGVLIIVGTGKSGPRPGHVIAFGSDGSTLWDFNTHDPAVMSALSAVGGAHSDCLEVRQIVVRASARKASECCVIALAVDPRWFTARLVALSLSSGELLGSFYHPGQLDAMTVAEGEAERGPIVAAIGRNNQLRKALDAGALNPSVALSLRLVGQFGQAVPGAFPGLPVIATDWYLVDPLLDAHFASVEWIDRDEDGNLDVQVSTSDGRYYCLNQGGELIGGAVGDNWIAREGGLPPPIPLSVVIRDSIWSLDTPKCGVSLDLASRAMVLFRRGLDLYQRGAFDSAATAFQLAGSSDPRLRPTIELWRRRAARRGQFGYLGVSVEADVRGLRVLTVEPNTAASRAGMRVGDIVCAIEGLTVGDLNDLDTHLVSTAPGDSVNVLVERHGRIVGMGVRLQSPPPSVDLWLHLTGRSAPCR